HQRRRQACRARLAWALELAQPTYCGDHHRRRDGTHEVPARLILAGQQGVSKIWAANNNAMSRFAVRAEGTSVRGGGTAPRRVPCEASRPGRHGRPAKPSEHRRWCGDRRLRSARAYTAKSNQLTIRRPHPCPPAEPAPTSVAL